MTTNAARAAMPDWATTGHRADPRALDRRRSYEAAGRRFWIDARGVVIEGEGGIPMALRAAAFRGVAARAMEDETGTVTVTLELMHEDEALCVPLLVAHDLDHVAADWREWARAFDLPMLMIEADGSVSRLDDKPVGHDRRPRPVARRPRFLVRRRTGHMGVAMRIEGTEFFAGR